MRILVLFLALVLSGCSWTSFPGADKVIHGAMGASTLTITDGCVLALVVGVAKEVNDDRTHEPDPMDAIATLAGCLIVRYALDLVDLP